MNRGPTLLAAMLIAGGCISSTGAEARGRRGAVVAAGIGGLAVGAFLGSALSARAAPSTAYEDRYAYEPPRVIYRPAPVREYIYDSGDAYEPPARVTYRSRPVHDEAYTAGYDRGFNTGYINGYIDSYWDAE